MKNVILAAAALASAFILTFGHAWHSPGIAQMKTKEGAVETPAGTRATGAFIVAMFWPLYWSTHLMEPSK